MKTKLFVDNVHGTIAVPEPLVKQLIDSEIFQRLRWIEQTGMRVIYPAARHDRFIHSLGVFFLGGLAFDRFKDNAQDVLGSDSPAPDWWNRHRLLFTIACLLHDCAHAAFSHTLEYAYGLIVRKTGDTDGGAAGTRATDIIKETLLAKGLGEERIDRWLRNKLSLLDWALVNSFPNLEFVFDFLQIKSKIEESQSGEATVRETVVSRGIEHERLSALILGTQLKGAITTACQQLLPDDQALMLDDFEFMARCIIGAQYSGTADRPDMLGVPENPIRFIERDLLNCFIQMLSADIGFDVDNLDYIVRDTTDSGFRNMSLNYERLLRSITIYQDEDGHHKLGFKEEGVHSIQEALQARNSIYTKIYPHHKVTFVNSFLKPELLKLAARWHCCKEYRADENREQCLLECLSVPCHREANLNPDEKRLSDDEIMAFLLGYTAYFDDKSAKGQLDKSRLRNSGLRPYMSTDADMDALFKQVYQECLELRNIRGSLDLQPKDEDGLKIIERYFSMYFSRDYDVTLYKNPELLARLVNPECTEEDEKDFWSLTDKDGNKQPLLTKLLLSLTSSRDELGITELWKDPVREVFERHGIEWPALVRYSLKTKSVGKLAIVKDDGSRTELSKLLLGNEEGFLEKRKDFADNYLFYLFGKRQPATADVGKPSLSPEEVGELFADLREFIRRRSHVPPSPRQDALDMLD